MNDEGPNNLAIASLLCGVLAIVGHGCCCLPIISYIAPFVVVTLEFTALGLGLVARSQADPEKGDPLALAGIVTSIVAMLMSTAYVVLTGGLVLAYLLAVVGLVVAGQ